MGWDPVGGGSQQEWGAMRHDEFAVFHIDVAILLLGAHADLLDGEALELGREFEVFHRGCLA